jgi:hypothetical protein
VSTLGTSILANSVLKQKSVKRSMENGLRPTDQSTEGLEHSEHFEAKSAYEAPGIIIARSHFQEEQKFFEGRYYSYKNSLRAFKRNRRIFFRGRQFWDGEGKMGNYLFLVSPRLFIS